MEDAVSDEEQQHVRACAAVLFAHHRRSTPSRLSLRSPLLSALNKLSSSFSSSSSVSSFSAAPAAAPAAAAAAPAAAAAAPAAAVPACATSSSLSPVSTRQCAGVAAVGGGIFSAKETETSDGAATGRASAAAAGQPAAETARAADDRGKEEKQEEEKGDERGSEEEEGRRTRKRRRNVFDQIYVRDEEGDTGSCGVTLRPFPRLVKRLRLRHGNERDAIPADIKKTLVRRLVLLLLGIMPHAVKHSFLRDAVFREPSFKRFHLKAVVKTACICMRNCLGLLLCREEVPSQKNPTAEPTYYVSQGVASPAPHLQLLRTEREHIIRGFLLFLAPCLIACRGVLHATELAVYVAACGREDLLVDFSEASLATLAATPPFSPSRPNAVANFPATSSTHVQQTLVDLLKECRALQYLSFSSSPSSSSSSAVASAADAAAPHPTEIRARARFVDEFSSKEFSKEVRDACGVEVPRGSLAGEEIQQNGEEEEEAEESEGERREEHGDSRDSDEEVHS